MSNKIKQMADVLRSGATLLSEACPQCNSPLFRMPTNEVYCVACNRRVIIVKDEAETISTVTPSVLQSLEEAVLRKLVELEGQIRTIKEPNELRVTVELLNAFLQALEKIRRIKPAGS